MDQRAPCRGTKNRAFIDPANSSPQAVRAAIKICRECPVRRECAAEALHAGELLEGIDLPATDVIAAGIVCTGTMTTARQLAALAKVPVPEYSTVAFTRPNYIGRPCLSCGRTLSKWTRIPEEVPPGTVMHYGRQYCVHCRKAYNAMLKEEGRVKRGRLRKHIDRHRHHKATARGRAATRARRRLAELQDAAPAAPIPAVVSFIAKAVTSSPSVITLAPILAAVIEVKIGDVIYPVMDNAEAPRLAA